MSGSLEKYHGVVVTYDGSVNTAGWVLYDYQDTGMDGANTYVSFTQTLTRNQQRERTGDLYKEEIMQSC